MELRWIGAADADAVAAAGSLFDHRPRPPWTQRLRYELGFDGTAPATR